MPNTEQSIEETGGIPEIELEVEVNGMTQTAVDKTLSVDNMAADAKVVGERFADDEADLSQALQDIEEIQGWTAEDIKMSDEEGAPTIAEQFTEVLGQVFPVGSLYMTTLTSLPDYISALGTWVEVAVPLSYGDIRKGTRSYAETESGFTPGTIRFWLRTE